MEIKLWLRQPLEQVPPVVSVTGTPAPSGTRATCDTDFTILAARGGKVEIRLSEDLVQELADGLDAHLSDGLVTADVERAAATLNTYANKTMTLTLERSTEGIIFSHHMQLATLICQGASNASRINLSDVRFVHARGSGMIDPKEAKKWVHSAKRLTELAFVSPEDVYGIVYERRIPPTSPLDLMDPFPFHFSTQAGIPDLVCTGKVNGITRNLFIVEVKASSVMGDKAFDDLDNLLQEGGGRATLRLVTVEETGFQVFSELRRDLTDVITQVR
ncbi:hypothetical protein I316_02697 [Kwoniella heveanensis BCC8398]|uniref:Uncharacterized protein n=1 Tax=Kwoniella heveanensis BCC8398 TaxID=1296120 RepID=A0A1B9GXA4_9TREE|nr:hypothetical protein I316_02697 [Kwoniella heveanensis BCC8398]